VSVARITGKRWGWRFPFLLGQLSPGGSEVKAKRGSQGADRRREATIVTQKVVHILVFLVVRDMVVSLQESVSLHGHSLDGV
jgi:hypothetical protein